MQCSSQQALAVGRKTEQIQSGVIFVFTFLCGSKKRIQKSQKQKMKADIVSQIQTEYDVNTE
jgi:hypothetical protein